MRSKARLANIRSLRSAPARPSVPRRIGSAAVAPTTLASAAYERMRTDVRHGRFKPGSKLHIEMLMQRYGMGRSPIREALNRLSSEALIVQEDQRGFRMPSASIEDLEELTRTRCWIYEIGLRESIARGNEDWEESVVLAYHRLSRLERCARKAATAGEADERIHRAFHAALISACGSRWLYDLAEKLFDLSDQYRALALEVQEHERDGPAEHKAIMEAVLDRNAPLAIELMSKHINLTAELVRRAVARVAEANGQ